LISR
jgi:hypothetical protein